MAWGKPLGKPLLVSTQFEKVYRLREWTRWADMHMASEQLQATACCSHAKGGKPCLLDQDQYDIRTRSATTTGRCRRDGDSYRGTNDGVLVMAVINLHMVYRMLGTLSDTPAKKHRLRNSGTST